MISEERDGCGFKSTSALYDGATGVGSTVAAGSGTGVCNVWQEFPGDETAVFEISWIFGAFLLYFLKFSFLRASRTQSITSNNQNPRSSNIYQCCGRTNLFERPQVVTAISSCKWQRCYWHFARMPHNKRPHCPFRFNLKYMTVENKAPQWYIWPKFSTKPIT